MATEPPRALWRPGAKFVLLIHLASQSFSDPLSLDRESSNFFAFSISQVGHFSNTFSWTKNLTTFSPFRFCKSFLFRIIFVKFLSLSVRPLACLKPEQIVLVVPAPSKWLCMAPFLPLWNRGPGCLP